MPQDMSLLSALFLTRVAAGEILWTNNRAISAHWKHQRAQRVERGSIEGPERAAVRLFFIFVFFVLTCH